jgi:hypothetical protein
MSFPPSSSSACASVSCSKFEPFVFVLLFAAGAREFVFVFEIFCFLVVAFALPVLPNYLFYA